MPAQDTRWQDQLIALFLLVSSQYQHRLYLEVYRLSNNDRPAFSDEEVLTLYLFGIINGQRSVKAIYDHTRDHLGAWFPTLPGYGGFVQRLNRLGSAFAALASTLIEELLREEHRRSSALGPIDPVSTEALVRLVDSFPIMLARAGRSDQARVATEVANKGYCASKDLFYHGVKLHLIGRRRPGALPLPEAVEITAASEHDLVGLYPMLPQLHGGTLAGDKIYRDRVLAAHLEKEQALRLITPVRRKRGQAHLLLTEALHSQYVSRLRQPIESFFNWLQEKTGIQIAAKVRSTAGLMVHIYGRLAAALYLLSLNP